MGQSCACRQVYTNQGVVARGRAAILQRLQSNAELHRAYGHGAHEVDAIDPQPLEVRVCHCTPRATTSCMPVDRGDAYRLVYVTCISADSQRPYLSCVSALRTCWGSCRHQVAKATCAWRWPLIQQCPPRTAGLICVLSRLLNIMTAERNIDLRTQA